MHIAHNQPPPRTSISQSPLMPPTRALFTHTQSSGAQLARKKMGIKKATVEMAFVHPWQKDPSPSASREHSYSIYRRRRERVPCHWKFSIHQWTQMTSWYQDLEESMNDWKNQRGGIREWAWELLHFTTSGTNFLNSRSGQSVACIPALLHQGVAKHETLSSAAPVQFPMFP